MAAARRGLWSAAGRRLVLPMAPQAAQRRALQDAGLRHGLQRVALRLAGAPRPARRCGWERGRCHEKEGESDEDPMEKG